MEQNINIIRNVSISEREEIIVDFARWLETASQKLWSMEKAALLSYLGIWRKLSA